MDLLEKLVFVVCRSGAVVVCQTTQHTADRLSWKGTLVAFLHSWVFNRTFLSGCRAGLTSSESSVYELRGSVREEC